MKIFIAPNNKAVFIWLYLIFTVPVFSTRLSAYFYDIIPNVRQLVIEAPVKSYAIKPQPKTRIALTKKIRPFKKVPKIYFRYKKIDKQTVEIDECLINQKFYNDLTGTEKENYKHNLGLAQAIRLEFSVVKDIDGNDYYQCSLLIRR